MFRTFLVGKKRIRVMMKLVTASVFALSMAACASAPPEVASAAPQNQGSLTVGGMSASEALGAVNTAKLVGSKPDSVTANQPTATGDSSTASTSTTTEGTLAVEGVSPASVLATIDTSKLVTNAKANEEAKTKASASLKRRTTKELAQAELEAVKTR